MAVDVLVFQLTATAGVKSANGMQNICMFASGGHFLAPLFRFVQCAEVVTSDGAILIDLYKP